MTGQTLSQLIHLAGPVAGLAAMCLVHALACRMNPRVPLLNALVRSGFAGLLVVVLAGVAAGWCTGRWEDSALAVFLVDAPIYACLAYGYANFVNLGQSSVRVRIYRELLDKPDGIAGEALRAEYDEQGMLRARLERLVEATDLRFAGGRYCIGRGRLVMVAAVIFGLKKAVLGRHSEFFP